MFSLLKRMSIAYSQPNNLMQKIVEINKDSIGIDERFFRKDIDDDFYGDNTKTKAELNWEYDMSFFDVLDILMGEEKKDRHL